jgi:membrane protein implicated in regulation of membrane protease activity
LTKAAAILASIGSIALGLCGAVFFLPSILSNGWSAVGNALVFTAFAELAVMLLSFAGLIVVLLIYLGKLVAQGLSKQREGD